MAKIIGIRREDKNIWEKRVPVTPQHVKELAQSHGIQTVIQPFENRAFRNGDYAAAGAKVNEDLSEASTIFAVKEVPLNLLMQGKTYVYFSHTIKAQSYNMPMLKKLMELGCTLIDYELITDETGRRMVFFGKFAGLAGMIDTLNGMGRRFKSMGYDTPFLKIKQAYQYKDINEAKNEISAAAKELKEQGLPEELSPLVVGFAGYGNVSKGAQEIFDILPFTEVTPDELMNLEKSDNKTLYKVVFKEWDMVKRNQPGMKFEPSDYYNNPENYDSDFEKYLDKITVLVNAIYWDDRYPRFVTKENVKNRPGLKLTLIGDITCDIDGAIEFTYKSTAPDNAAFVYDPDTGEFKDGYEGKGIAVIAVDNLPTELPRDSSVAFSESLIKFVPGIAEADYGVPFDNVNLPPEIKKAVIVYKGELTPEFEYLREYLPRP